MCAPDAAPGLVELSLVRERLIVVMPARHRLAARRTLHPRDLDQQPYVGVRPDIEPAWAQAAFRALKLAGAVPRLVQETDTKLSLLGLVAAGLGLSVVSESMGELTRKGVVIRPLSGLSLRLSLALLTPPAATPRAAAFAQLARQTFSTRTSG